MRHHRCYHGQAGVKHGDYHRRFIAFYNYVEYQFFMVTSRRYRALVNHSVFAFLIYSTTSSLTPPSRGISDMLFHRQQYISWYTEARYLVPGIPGIIFQTNISKESRKKKRKSLMKTNGSAVAVAAEAQQLLQQQQRRRHSRCRSNRIGEKNEVRSPYYTALRIPHT